MERIERIELKKLRPFTKSSHGFGAAEVLFSASEDGSGYDVVAIVSLAAEDDAEFKLNGSLRRAFDTGGRSKLKPKATAPSRSGIWSAATTGGCSWTRTCP